VPSILVPYPTAADDHQTRNAEIFSQAGAAILMPESQLNATTLVEAVGSILSDPKKKAAMVKAANALAVRDSAAKIANIVEECIS
jgi:UDP-N-acetylglucosamine--N-acetylmuramyl-(pentapeptide) pyrophosphoryl-undecaprenol N-acetylglucosamine transferase